METRTGLANITRNSEILCKVQHILEDLIVVTFIAPNNKPFQGVLLDSTKRNIPFGVNPLGGFNKQLLEDNPRDFDSEVYRRHTYYLEDKVSKPPLLVPSGKNGKSFLSQDRLGVRLRARQVLCSKCSEVCNEAGQNVREQGNKQPRTRSFNHNRETEQGRNLRVVRPRAVSKVHNLKENEPCSSTASPGVQTRTKTRVKYFGMKKRKGKRKKGGAASNSEKHCDTNPSSETYAVPLKMKKIRDIPEEIVDLDDKTRRLAKRNCLVPKLKRLAPSEIERYSDMSNSDRESCSDSEKNPTKRPTVFRVTSSSSNLPRNYAEASMQPLKIKFSNLNKENSSSRQYSIVQTGTEPPDSDGNKRNCDEGEDKLDNKMVERESGEREKTGPGPGPVLKISFGKESHVLTVSGREASREPEAGGECEDSENVKPSRTHYPAAQTRAAKKALKRAKREAAKRGGGAGLVSPGRKYLGAKSPANFSPGQSPAYRPSLPSPASLLGGFSPGSSSRFSSPASPAYTLMCPSSQKLIIKKIKKKKKKEKKEKVNLDETPTSSGCGVETEMTGNSEDDISGNILEEGDGVSDPAIEETAVEGGIPVESAAVAGGGTLCVGDVVWGQTEADCSPWWPGKILNLMMLEDSQEVRARAQVSWYKTSDTSLLPLNSLKPFLEMYEERVRNSPRTREEEEAVELAMKDARLALTVPIVGLSPSPSGSPREVCV